LTSTRDMRKKDNKNLRVWRTDERRVQRQQGEIRAIGCKIMTERL